MFFLFYGLGGSSLKHVAIYYRVSTDRQDLASQKNAVERWLEALPEEKKPLSIKVFKDQGISGKTALRKGYQDLLKAAYEKQIDTIIVYRLDRLSRNATEAIQTLLSLDQAGVGFISVTQAVLNLGLDNPFRRTMLAAFSEIAEIERETIVGRVKSGLASAKARGVKLGRPKKMNAEVQRKVKAMRGEGYTYQAIADALGLGRGTVQNLDKSDLLDA
jgi:DNA invertase Pin-like site-specific DNA recombinase